MYGVTEFARGGYGPNPVPKMIPGARAATAQLKGPRMTLPVITVTARTLPEAWEQAVVRTWNEGAAIATQYDKPDDPPSRDATAVVVVEQPFAEPRIHRAFPGGIVELECTGRGGGRLHDPGGPGSGQVGIQYRERMAPTACRFGSRSTSCYIVDAQPSAAHAQDRPHVEALIGGNPRPACLHALWCARSATTCDNITCAPNTLSRRFHEHVRFTDRSGRSRSAEREVGRTSAGAVQHIADASILRFVFR